MGTVLLVDNYPSFLSAAKPYDILKTEIINMQELEQFCCCFQPIVVIVIFKVVLIVQEFFASIHISISWSY